MLIFILTDAVALFLYINIFLAEATMIPKINIAFAIFFIILIALFVLVCLKVLAPLYRVEKMIFKNYYEVASNRNQPIDLLDIGIDHMIETVISRQHDSWNRELTANLLRQKAEFAGLQSQINPHFLYNTLDSIRGFALMKKVPEIAQMTEALSRLFRSNMKKSGMMVSLREEITSVEDYLFIQKFRFQDRFVFEMQILDDAEEVLQCKIPSFIIQPVIENAIYHGLETMFSNGRIQLIIYHTQTRLIMRVNDNGCGIHEDKLNQLISELQSPDLSQSISDDAHMGIGLVNINQRIKIQYGDEYGLFVASTPDVGTQVEITLPYVN